MNITRWSSKKNMLDRFFELLPQMISPEAQTPAVISQLYGKIDVDLAEYCLNLLKSIEIVSLNLQSDSCSLATGKQFMELLANKFPIMKKQLLKNFDVEENPNNADFLNGICKIQSGQEDNLTNLDETAVKSLKQNAVAGEGSVLSFNLGSSGIL